MARITVRLTPRAGRDAVDFLDDDGVVRARVAAAPADGAANRALLRLLAATFDIPQSHLRIVTGAASRTKVVEIDGLDNHKIRSAIEHQ